MAGRATSSLGEIDLAHYNSPFARTTGRFWLVQNTSEVVRAKGIDSGGDRQHMDLKGNCF